MQATVHTFEPDSTKGSVILDTGKVVPFSEEVFAASGLRHLRVGQRLSIEVAGDPEAAGAQLTRLWLVGIGPHEEIR